MPRPRSRRTAKAAGTKWESAIVTYLKGAGWEHARRKAKAGGRDTGDVTPGDGSPVTIEAKDVRARDLAGWVREAVTEAQNAGVPIGVAWAKAAGKPSPADGYVIMDGATFVEVLRRLANIGSSIE